jgi:cytochrome c-type biogenesis protein CcmH
MKPVTTKRTWSAAIFFAVMLAAAGLFILAGQVSAQSTPTPNEVDAVAKDLWCPLCNGVRLDNCELQACVQMREEISQKLAAGQSKNDIKTYFVQRYGDVVLGMPSNQGVNLVIWILPILLGVLGLGTAAYLAIIWARRRPVPIRAGFEAGDDRADSNADDDDYMKRVDEELEEYE